MALDDSVPLAELIRLAKGGDAVSMNNLIARYYDRVRQMIARRFSPRLATEDEVDEILQEVFALLVTTIDRCEIRDEKSWLAWLDTRVEHQVKAAGEQYGTPSKADPRGDADTSVD